MNYSKSVETRAEYDKKNDKIRIPMVNGGFLGIFSLNMYVPREISKAVRRLKEG
jgi:hypothetical protein